MPEKNNQAKKSITGFLEITSTTSPLFNMSMDVEYQKNCFSQTPYFSSRLQKREFLIVIENLPIRFSTVRKNNFYGAQEPETRPEIYSEGS